ncbi:hypothetical protein D3C78_1423070 [compost metagenome]
MLDELLHLATPLADQADHHHISTGEARHHAQQHRLADTGAGKQAQTLAAPHRQQAVDRAHTDIQHIAHRRAPQRIQRLAVQRVQRLGHRLGTTVQRPAQ